jgi:Ni,Fe-hydrogenase maturation factor
LNRGDSTKYSAGRTAKAINNGEMSVYLQQALQNADIIIIVDFVYGGQIVWPRLTNLKV